MTRKLLLESRRWHQSRSTSSTTESHGTHATASTSTDDRSMGMLRIEAIVHIVVGATTATRTGGLLSHRALESSARQSAARHYPTHFGL